MLPLPPAAQPAAHTARDAAAAGQRCAVDWQSRATLLGWWQRPPPPAAAQGSARSGAMPGQCALHIKAEGRLLTAAQCTNTCRAQRMEVREAAAAGCVHAAMWCAASSSCTRCSSPSHSSRCRCRSAAAVSCCSSRASSSARWACKESDEWRARASCMGAERARIRKQPCPPSSCLAGTPSTSNSPLPRARHSLLLGPQPCEPTAPHEPPAAPLRCRAR